MKKIYLSPIIALSLFTSEALADEAMDACGALLCILGGQTKGECKKYYQKYLAVKDYKNPANTFKKRQDFLKLCPTQEANNVASSAGISGSYEVVDLNEGIKSAAMLDGECTEAELNRVERRVIGYENVQGKDPDNGQDMIYQKEIQGIRVNPQITNACSVLTKGKYSTKKVTYTCPTSEFYTIDEWNKGFKGVKISKAEYYKLENGKKFTKEVAIIDNGTFSTAKTYNSLPQDEKGRYDRVEDIFYKKEFYRKEPVNYTCWKVEDNF